MPIEGLLTFHISIFESPRFTGQNALSFHQAVTDAVSNIKAMPAKYTSFPNGPRVYGVTSGHRVRLAKARGIIVDWWNDGYVNNANTLIGERFRTEATASLPGIVEAPSPETIFDGMEFQRLRLHPDQQVPEWQ